MKQLYLLIIRQICLMSQMTLKKINWLFLLSPIDTGVTKLTQFSFICLKEKNDALLFFNFSFKQENKHADGVFI